MMRSYPLVHLKSIPLAHAGDCSLLGVDLTDDGDFVIYFEEMYGEGGWLAQGAVTLTGTLLAQVDENKGTNSITPLELPPTIKTPRACWNTMRLNYAGPRHRGLRDPERLVEVLRPISVADKFAIVKQLALSIAPPLLLGVAESYVLSEATVVHPDLFFVCRRLRLAYAFEQEQTDSDGQAYDYDTHIIHTAHFYDRRSSADSEPALIDALNTLPKVELRRPMDCVVIDDVLFVADAAHLDSDSAPSAIHVWRIEIPDEARHRPSEEEKLYG